MLKNTKCTCIPFIWTDDKWECEYCSSGRNKIKVADDRKETEQIMHEVVLSPRYVTVGETATPMILRYTAKHDADMVADALVKVRQWQYTKVEVRETDHTTFKDFSGPGTLMTISEFLDNVDNLSLIDFDGSGCLATETQESNVWVTPSNVMEVLTNHPKYREWATHVMWFNK